MRGALAGAGEPAYGPIMKGHWAYSPVAEKPYDPDEAGRQLDAAGWRREGGGIRAKGANKLSFTLVYPSADSVRKDIALAFASDMKKIGVEVKLEGLSWDVIEKRQDSGAVEFGYGTPYDPDIELYTLFHSKFATGDEDFFTNFPKTRNAAIDATLDSERSTLDRNERKRDFVKLQEELANDASWLWLVRLRHIAAISKRVKGVDPQVEPHAHGFSRGMTWNLENWTLDPKS
ncbi:MAG: peptide/nickel transport system substrate-binding protein [Solirubrobacteraceae bacterium]|nr:peptide/nickel transport system substrate-binding protein [Solirubrobacteraceae bacterium]